MLISTRFCFRPQDYIGQTQPAANKREKKKRKKERNDSVCWVYELEASYQNWRITSLPDRKRKDHMIHSFSLIPTASPPRLWVPPDSCFVLFCVALTFTQMCMTETRSDLSWSTCLVNLICPACEARLSWFSGHFQLISLQTLVLTLTSTKTSPLSEGCWCGKLGCDVRASTVSVCCDLCQEMCCS